MSLGGLRSDEWFKRHDEEGLRRRWADGGCDLDFLRPTSKEAIRFVLPIVGRTSGLECIPPRTKRGLELNSC